MTFLEPLMRQNFLEYALSVGGLRTPDNGLRPAPWNLTGWQRIVFIPTTQLVGFAR
jgi:hypothetical protein